MLSLLKQSERLAIEYANHLMNRRLFWKILIVFWIIFVVAFQTTWIAFSFYVERNRERLSSIHVPTKVQMIAQLLRISGEQEAAKFISNLPDVERQYFVITPIEEFEGHLNSAQDSLNIDNYLYREIAIAPNDAGYLVAFLDTDNDNNNAILFNMPIPLILMGLFSGLIFSLLLAWNLTRPMKLLQKGFYRVAQGDLSVRLYAKLKRRHDELSDLARDFDSMVEHLNILMSERQALLHDVSHELRTPLARLQLAIGLAQQNTQNIDGSLQRIELESQRLDQLIGEILTFSRSESICQLDEYFDLEDLIRVVVDDANYEAQLQNIQVVFSALPLSQSIIIGNAEHIRRAVENIIRNAIRFSESGQKIEIKLQESGKYLQIDIRDHGPGIDEYKLSSIFEPFVRIQSPRLGKGYGLGLAIARKTVQVHNGIIQAKNADEGGFLVTIKLPYWRPE